MNLEIYQKLCSESKILWTQHCLQRMQERAISRAAVSYTHLDVYKRQPCTHAAFSE